MHSHKNVKLRLTPALRNALARRSSPFSGFDNAGATGEPNIHVVKSPKSGVNFFNLGDVEAGMQSAALRARPIVEQVVA